MENFTKEEVVPDVIKETPKGKLTVSSKNVFISPLSVEDILKTSEKL